MALTILNNIAALAAQNQLNITSSNLQSTLEQLSSGSRINSGADDPAGLAIANGLSANIAALTQSASNATGGVGELQVADGALSQVTTLLDRAVTLATESATGTVSNSQRTALDSEYQSIKSEIDSIGSTTNYNGGQVFTANTLNVFLGDGSTTGSSTIGVTTGLLSSNSLNLGGALGATGTLTQTAGTAAVAASDILTNTGAIVAATAADSTLTVAGTGPAALDTVTVGTTVYTFETALTSGGTANQVVVGSGGTAGQNAAQSLINLAAAINATAGGAGTNYGNGTVANTFAHATVTSGTVDTITANINGAGSVAGGTGNSVALASGTAGDLVAASTTLGGAGGVAATAGNTVAVGGQTYTFVAALSTNPTANEVVYGTTPTTALNHLIEAVNKGNGSGTDYSALTAQNANVTAGPLAAGAITFTSDVAGAAGNFLTGVANNNNAFATPDFTGGLAAGNPGSAVAGDTVAVGTQTYTYVNVISSPTANETEVLVGATDTASLANLANAVNGGSGAGSTYAYGSAATANTSATAVAGANSVTFTAIAKGTAGNAIISTTGGSGANTFGGLLLTGGAANSINDLLTQPDAQAALSLIDGAVAAVAALRGNIGSTVNRLQSASNVITNQVQNLTAAENNVTAADIPTVVANLTQYSILEQTGISALTQANQQQQLVLKLLQ
jgi:flagellin